MKKIFVLSIIALFILFGCTNGTSPSESNPTNKVHFVWTYGKHHADFILDMKTGITGTYYGTLNFTWNYNVVSWKNANEHKIVFSLASGNEMLWFENGSSGCAGLYAGYYGYLEVVN